MFPHPGPNRNRRFKIVDSDMVSFMETVNFKKTDESLGEIFGISYNTWRKIARQEPVRYSLANRLERRISLMRLSDTAPPKGLASAN